MMTSSNGNISALLAIFVWGIHRSPVNSPHKGQWRGALMFSSICVWINSWVNNRKAGGLRCHRPHYDVTVMICYFYEATMISFRAAAGVYVRGCKCVLVPRNPLLFILTSLHPELFSWNIKMYLHFVTFPNSNPEEAEVVWIHSQLTQPTS